MRISDWSSDVCASDLSDTPKQTVETDLLFRAAELTLKSGHDYFVFASDSTDASTRYLQSFDGFYGGWGPYYRGPRSASGGGFGASTPPPIPAYVGQATVAMFQGQKQDPDVQDLKSVVEGKRGPVRVERGRSP